MRKPNINTKKYINGTFKPKNPNKYVGNITNIIYRSSYERTFMIYCDSNINILRWSSEPLAIPYLNPIDNKIHKYFIDFWIETNKGKFLIEIKPYNQLSNPVLLEKKYSKKQLENFIYSKKEYIKNLAKWKAAKQFAAQNNWNFWIITEKDLNKLLGD